MKINKKGFMMAELVVVSAIVLTTLVSLYTSYNKIHSIYKSRVGYYDVTTLYRLGYYRDFMDEYDLLEVGMNKALNNEDKFITIYKSVDGHGKFNSDIFSSLPSYVKINEQGNIEDTVFLVYNNKSVIDSSMFDKVTINSTFKDYINFLKDSIDFSKFEYMLIMERCNLNNDSVDINSCSYGYLELFQKENNDDNM